mgnify:CR=1 FL=1
MRILDTFTKSSASAIDFEIEVFPLVLYLIIIGKLRIGRNELVAVADSDFEHIGKQKCSDALALIVGTDGNEHKVPKVGTMKIHGLEHVIPAEWEEMSVGLLLSSGHRRTGDGKGDEIVVTVGNKADAVETEKRKVEVDVVLNLAVVELGDAIEVRIGIVEQFEDLVTIALLEALGAGLGKRLQAIVRLDEFGHTLVLIGHLLGNRNEELVPYSIFGHTIGLEMVDVVGVVVDGRHGGELVEALDQCAFIVEVGESERTR